MVVTMVVAMVVVVVLSMLTSLLLLLPWWWMRWGWSNDALNTHACTSRECQQATKNNISLLLPHTFNIALSPLFLCVFLMICSHHAMTMVVVSPLPLSTARLSPLLSLLASRLYCPLPPEGLLAIRRK